MERPDSRELRGTARRLDTQNPEGTRDPEPSPRLLTPRLRNRVCGPTVVRVAVPQSRTVLFPFTRVLGNVGSVDDFHPYLRVFPGALLAGVSRGETPGTFVSSCKDRVLVFAVVLLL